MKNFKNFFLLLLTVSAVSFTSCTKEDSDCTAPAVETNIVGTWTVEMGDGGTAEFKSDGTLVDPTGEIFEVEVNGVNYSEKTYTVANDTLSIVAKDPNSTNSGNASFAIKENECNKITLDSGLGIDFVLNRE